MVKRTVVVLGILSLVLLMAGTSFALTKLCGPYDPAPPLFAPVDCPPYLDSQTIVKKWSCKIETPYYAGMGPAGVGILLGRRLNRRRYFRIRDRMLYGPFFVADLAGTLATPFDWIFGGRGGVRGCHQGLHRFDGPCGPFFGAIPRAFVNLMPVTWRFFGVIW